MLASAPKGLAVPRELGVTCEHLGARLQSEPARVEEYCCANSKLISVHDVRRRAGDGMGAPRSRRAPRSREVAGLARPNAKLRSKPAQPRHEPTLAQDTLCNGEKSLDRRGVHAVLSPSERLLLLRNDRLVGLSPEDRQQARQRWLLRCGRRFNRATSTYRRPFLRPGDRTGRSSTCRTRWGSEARTCASWR